MAVCCFYLLARSRSRARDRQKAGAWQSAAVSPRNYRGLRRWAVVWVSKSRSFDPCLGRAQTRRPRHRLLAIQRQADLYISRLAKNRCLPPPPPLHPTSPPFPPPKKNVPLITRASQKSVPSTPPQRPPPQKKIRLAFSSSHHIGKVIRPGRVSA